MRAIGMRRWTRKEYEGMVATGVFPVGTRVELVDGQIMPMTPQSSVHATMIQLLQDALRVAVGPAFSIRPQLPISLGPDSEPEPDLAVVQGNPRNYMHGHPTSALLLVEVADSSLEYDRERKGRLYARAGIRDYWIVNLIDRCIEVYRDPRDGIYRSARHFFPGEAVAPLEFPQAMIPLTGVFDPADPASPHLS